MHVRTSVFAGALSLAEVGVRGNVLTRTHEPQATPLNVVSTLGPCVEFAVQRAKDVDLFSILMVAKLIKTEILKGVRRFYCIEFTRINFKIARFLIQKWYQNHAADAQASQTKELYGQGVLSRYEESSSVGTSPSGVVNPY